MEIKQIHHLCPTLLLYPLDNTRLPRQWGERRGTRGQGCWQEEEGWKEQGCQDRRPAMGVKRNMQCPLPTPFSPQKIHCLFFLWLAQVYHQLGLQLFYPQKRTSHSKTWPKIIPKDSWICTPTQISQSQAYSKSSETNSPFSEFQVPKNSKVYTELPGHRHA